MRLRIFVAIVFFLTLTGSGFTQSLKGYPKIVWEDQFSPRIIEVAFSNNTAQTAVLTPKDIILLDVYGKLVWERPNTKDFRQVIISNNASTVLLRNDNNKQYQVVNHEEGVKTSLGKLTNTLLTNNGDYVLDWRHGGKEIAVYNLNGVKVKELAETDFIIQDVKLPPKDSYVLVLGNKSGKREIRKFFLERTGSEVLPADFKVTSFDELIISGMGRYLANNDSFLDLASGGKVIQVEPKIVALTNDGSGYLSLDYRKRKLRYGEFAKRAPLWEKSHTLDQWQEVYVDRFDRYIISLSYLQSAVENTLELYDLQGNSLLMWRLDWNENSRIKFTYDLRYALVRQGNRLTLYQIY